MGWELLQTVPTGEPKLIWEHRSCCPFTAIRGGGALFASHGVARDMTPTKEGSRSLVSLRSWAFGPQHREQLISGVACGEAELATND